jgi:hypothetical protein
MEKQPQVSDSWKEQQAFCVARLGMSLADARSLEPGEFKVIYKHWLDEKKWQERLVARLCAVVSNLVSKTKRSESDYMTIGKKDEGEEVTAKDIIRMLTTPKKGKTNGK